MDIKSQKISSFKNPVSTLPDQPIMQSSDLKLRFDSNSLELQQSLNNLIDILSGEGGASALGANPFAGIRDNTIQAQIMSLQENINNIISGVIPPETVTSDMIANESITSAKLSDDVLGYFYVNGTYIGDASPLREINLGFHPSAVIIEVFSQQRLLEFPTFRAVALRDNPCYSLLAPAPTTPEENMVAKVTENGFNVIHRTGDLPSYINYNNYLYYYIAFK